MTKDESGTTDGATAAKNLTFVPKGKFTVVAKDGISYSHASEPDGFAEKGDEIELEGAIIQTLLNEGAIEPA